MSETRSSQDGKSPALAAQAATCAVLVMSCDAYRDLWTPFFTLFWRYWPDCPFPVYLGTNSEQIQHPRVTTLTAGDHEWSQRLSSHLQRIDGEYILLLLEDYLFTNPISTSAITESLNLLHRLSGTVLRLSPRPGPDQPLPAHSGVADSNVGQLDRYACYRVSTQAAIWSKAGLVELLQDHESIWDFEWKGTVRSQGQPDGFYSVYKTVMPYKRVLERGQWFPSAAKYFNKQQVGCDFKGRRVMSRATEIRKAITGNSKALFYWILPRRLRF